MNLLLLTVLLLFSNLLFALGLFAPCMIVSPGFGEFTTLFKLLKPEIGMSKSVSIFSGIWELFASGSYFVGLVIFIFSVLFPIWKFGIYWGSLILLYLSESPNRRLARIDKLGKYSMLDIFVIALILLAIKGLPGGTAVHLSWGVFAFALSIIISLGLPACIHRAWSAMHSEANK